ncbi:cadherin-16 [Rhinoraja longicauda]
MEGEREAKEMEVVGLLNFRPHHRDSQAADVTPFLCTQHNDRSGGPTLQPDEGWKSFAKVFVSDQVCALMAVLGVLSAATVVTVPENYDGHFPWFLTKVETNISGEFRLRLEDDYNGTFGIEGQTFLFSRSSFDREERGSYELQVAVVDDEGAQLDEPVSITINVTDRNDNAPQFEQDTFLARVYMGAPAGYRILKVAASDRDEASTLNADLRYQIISQQPELPSDNMFQVNPLTGHLTLTTEGAATLDADVADHYQLAVQVKDMGGLSQGHYAQAHILINVTQNTWVSLSPVSVRENHEGPYPFPLSKVRWNGERVRYRLRSQPPAPHGLFTVSERGSISLSRPLDREEQPEYRLWVSALDYTGELYAEPLELQVTVTDENDNAPVCSPEIHVALVTEHRRKGTCIVQLRGEDEDDPSTENGQFTFRLQGQEPEGPEEPLFTVDGDGRVTLARDMTDYRSPTYRLLVEVADLAGAEGGLSSTCTVIVDVDELNDHEPEFSQQQYGPFNVPEDTAVGHVITSISASDTDFNRSDAWLITYALESGNEGQRFGIVQGGQSNIGKLILHKPLDFEAVSEYRLVVSARNIEELEDGEYGPTSTTTLSVRVQDVNERPEFLRAAYEFNVSREVQPGTVLLTLQAHDPDSAASPIRYRLGNESGNWLSVGATSGKVTVQGRPPAARSHRLEVWAEDGDDPSLFVTTSLVVHVAELRERPPGPLLVYSGTFLCTPRREEQAISVTVSHRARLATLSLDGHPMERRKWKLEQKNDTLAFLSIGLSWVDPGLHQVTIVLREEGDSTVTLRDTLPVNICTCSSHGKCRIEVEPIQGKPTVLMTVSTIVGTLAVIGFSLILVLVHLSITGKQRRKSKRDVSVEAAPLRPSQ